MNTKKDNVPMAITVWLAIFIVIGLIWHFAIKPTDQPVSQPIVAPRANTAVSMPPVPQHALSTTEASSAANSEWEPIGKYSNKEIQAASSFIGKLREHGKKLDLIEERATKAVRSAYRQNDSYALTKAFAGYTVDAIEQKEAIYSLQMPYLENQQAADNIADALTSLKRVSEVQNARAAMIGNAMSSETDGEKFAAKLKEIDIQRTIAVMGMVKVYAAYLSYGFTEESVNGKTLTLKPNAKPNRSNNH